MEKKLLLGKEYYHYDRDYWVSESGDVIKLHWTGKVKFLKRAKYPKRNIWYVNLVVEKGKCKHVQLSRIMYQVFVSNGGPMPEGCYVTFKDGNSLNFSKDNLQLTHGKSGTEEYKRSKRKEYRERNKEKFKAYQEEYKRKKKEEKDSGN